MAAMNIPLSVQSILRGVSEGTITSGSSAENPVS